MGDGYCTSAIVMRGRMPYGTSWCRVGDRDAVELDTSCWDSSPVLSRLLSLQVGSWLLLLYARADISLNEMISALLGDGSVRWRCQNAAKLLTASAMITAVSIACLQWSDEFADENWEASMFMD